MPPRHSYWTILIDNAPTAFRAASRDELLPTFERLRRTQPSAVMRWFARGRVWTSPFEAEQAARAPRDQRGASWRPGGQHRDPREAARQKRKALNSARRAERFDRRQEREQRRGGGAPERRDERARREERARPASGAPARRPPFRPDERTPKRPAPHGNRPWRDGASPSPPAHRKPEHAAGRSPYGAGAPRDRKRPLETAGARKDKRRPPAARTKHGPNRRQPTPFETPRPRREKPPAPPPGPDRPPRPGHEPKPEPVRPEEIVTPYEPPERGSVGGPGGTRLIKRRRS